MDYKYFSKICNSAGSAEGTTKWYVVRLGGSVGERHNVLIEQGTPATLLAGPALTEKEARDEVKRRNATLTKAEKHYYGIYYRAVRKDKIHYIK